MNIRKIAELAGVSVATVSRVINHPERVLAKTKDRVLNVMEEHNYTPNWFARGLNLGTTDTIALLVPNINSDLYQRIISGIETVAGNKGYAVIFRQTRGDAEAEYSFLKMLKTRKVDGVIQVETRMDPTVVPEIKSSELPTVHVGKNAKGICHLCCYLDYEEAAYRLFRHLFKLGHKTIGFLFDENRDALFDDIEAGYQRAKRDISPYAQFFPHQSEDTTFGGYLALQKMIQKNELPEAVITSNDLQAIGAMKAARDMNISIPGQLALASMNDSPVCSVVTPAVTSIDMPATKLGMAAARLLLDRIEEDDEDTSVVHEMILQPKLKIRESCGNTTDIFELFD